MCKCEICNSDFENYRALNGHKRIHKNGNTNPSKKKYKPPLIKTDSFDKIGDDLYQCSFCEKSYSKKGIGNHVWRNHTEEGRLFKSTPVGFMSAWNKGLTNETDERVRLSSETRNKHIKDGTVKIGGHKCTEKRKEELRKFLLDNPKKVPYLLNHSSKESYPEFYFNEVFSDINLIKRYFRIGIYELDFSIPEKKIDIEIDGNQHYENLNIIESDKRRNNYLETLGWDIIRVRWKKFNKLNSSEKQDYILNLKNRINELIDSKSTTDVIFIEKPIKDDDFICKCGILKFKRCQICFPMY